MVKTRRKKILPKVSIIMPVHNAAEFLDQAIQSMLDQTFKKFELIIINDGSTDDSKKIAQKFVQKDKRVKLISYQRNKGESAAGNLGFLKAKGEYIARMDADDIAHPKRIEKQVAFLDKNPDYIVVGSQAHIIDENDIIVGEKVFPKTHEAIFKEYGNLHPMLHPSLMFRRSLLPWTNKLWANKAEPNDDYYTLFHFLQHGKFANLGQKLHYYRMHSNNKSMQHVKKKFVNSLKIRFYAWKNLGYRPAVSTYLKLVVQSAVVLTLPESLTLGLFFVMKGIKPFDQAFPIILNLKQSVQSLKKAEFALPVLVASTLESLSKR